MWELAGYLRMDPRPFTLRQLFTMARGLSEQLWDHTAALLAQLHNAWRGDEPAATALDFHPLRRAEADEEPVAREVAPIGVLKQMYVKGQQ